MIFLDNASTTKINKHVNDLIYKINCEDFYNPSALYEKSIDVQNLIEEAKQNIANILNAKASNIVFTSGATEANNTAILGLSTNNKNAEYIFSAGEHPSVIEVANLLKSQGKIVHFVNLTQAGIVDEEHFKSLLNKNTSLVSIMHVSNETGAINDIKKLCSLAKKINPNCVFHCDGVQAIAKIPVDINNLGVDSYSCSAHKFHGPKGVGFVYIKNLNKLKPLLVGGGQQHGYRSGTENVSGILGMSLALSLANENINESHIKANEFRKNFVDKIKTNLNNYIINESENNSPYILSVSFKNLKGEIILHMLEKYGVLIGTGSACSSKKSNNAVLQNMKRDKSYILGSIRISFSRNNTLEEINEASDRLIDVVKELTEKVA